MSTTSKLGLELLQNAAANQTLANTTFAQLNQLVQPAVLDKDLNAPPTSPADEALYIVGPSPTGAWAGKAAQLAYWLNTTSAWQFISPQNGFMVKVLDEAKWYDYTGSVWEVFSSGETPAEAVDIVRVYSHSVTDLSAITAGVINLVYYDASVSSFGTSAKGTHKTVIRTGSDQADGVTGSSDTGTVTLVHSSALRLPGAANIVMVIGDSAEFISLGSGNWYCSQYTRGSVAP
jgi:hypothetical protein